jgi:dephospho-CoA kinase
MIILGLTGSIGVGKSNVAKEFRRLRVPVFDADKVVHKLLYIGGAGVKKVAEVFPEVLENGAINRKKLGEIVFKDREKLETLEKIIHPLVRKAEQKFLRKAYTLKKKIVILDIPLLFEKGFNHPCQYTIVVVAPHFIQRARVLRRRNMDLKKFEEIKKLQLPQSEKMRRADFIIRTGLDKRSTKRQVRAIYRRFQVLGFRFQQGI